MLSGELAVLQATQFDGLSFDPFSLFDDVCGPAEVGVGRGDVTEALVVAAMIVVLHEGFDLALEIAGRTIGVGPYEIIPADPVEDPAAILAAADDAATADGGGE